MAQLPLIELGVETLISTPGFRVTDPTPTASGSRYLVLRDNSLLSYAVECRLYGRFTGGGGVWYPLADVGVLVPNGEPFDAGAAISASNFTGEYAVVFVSTTRDRRVTATIETHF